jgi:hypothetical protein
MSRQKTHEASAAHACCSAQQLASAQGMHSRVSASASLQTTPPLELVTTAAELCAAEVTLALDALVALAAEGAPPTPLPPPEPPLPESGSSFADSELQPSAPRRIKTKPPR